MKVGPRHHFRVRGKGKGKIRRNPADVLARAIKGTKRAYADSYLPFDEAEKIRILDWHGTPWLTPSQLRVVVKIVGSYNKFDPERTYEKLANENVEVKLGRESSVVIYVKGNQGVLRGVAGHFKRYADEVDFVQKRTLYPDRRDEPDFPLEQIEKRWKWRDEHTKVIKFKEPLLRLWWD